MCEMDESYLLSIIIDGVFIVISFGWVKLWLHICGKGNAVIRNIVMIILSLGVVYIAAQIVFLPVDDTYSYSNICAQGLWMLMFLKFFVPASVIAMIISVCRAITERGAGDRYGERL